MSKVLVAVSGGAITGVALVFSVVMLNMGGGMLVKPSTNHTETIIDKINTHSQAKFVFLEQVAAEGHTVKGVFMDDILHDSGKVAVRAGTVAIALVDRNIEGTLQTTIVITSNGQTKVLKGLLLWGRYNVLDKDMKTVAKVRQNRYVLGQITAALYGVGKAPSIKQQRLISICDELGLNNAKDYMSSHDNLYGITDHPAALAELASAAWRFERIYGWHPEGAAFLPMGTSVTLT